ncbi:MAG: hypothetical protein ACK5IA_14000 [Cyanobacteriota bacterium]|jgi:hypothetical protein
MSFDARSRERLEALGRQLPRKLPVPSAEPAAAAGAKEQARLHRVETEQNPEQLFRELMAASPDGSVPPHLMDRLRQLESSRRPEARPTPEGVPALDGGTNKPSAANRPNAANKPNRARPRPAAEDLSLYAAFEQLLLEDDDDA